MPSVLITGASRGIGRATALRMAAAGWDVHAGVRRPEDGDALLREAPGRGQLFPVTLDVTDEVQVGGLTTSLPDLDAVVNNAGIVVGGPVESVPLEELRRQLDVNVVAQVGVTQAVLPALRRSHGRVVFISSISGRVSTPMMSPYTASKFAVEAIADALRLELRPWKIDVVLVEPGSIDTDLWRKADGQVDETESAMTGEHRRLYAGHLEGMRKAIPRIQKAAAPVDSVAAAIEKALTAGRPRPRYLVGNDARVQLALRTGLPTRTLDRVLGTFTGTPRK
jgi:NAD(P)-dependent dehydrogenase (short-subunit alcohol dehydrogenase family)